MGFASARDAIGEYRDIKPPKQMFYRRGDLIVENFLLCCLKTIDTAECEGEVLGCVLGIGDFDERGRRGGGAAGGVDDYVFGKLVGLGGADAGDDANRHNVQ